MSRKKWSIAITLGLLLFLGSPFVIQTIEQNKIYALDKVPEQEVAIVFGAGLKKDGTPSDALKDRLTVAAELYQAGSIQKILVSGDNRFENYNEPDVMSAYLQTQFGIPAEAIAEDYAGRRTYDTCIRAKTIWNVDAAILITQDFHLPRALYTCESLGIDSVGVSASLQPYLFQKWYHQRETLATLKMLWDLYLWNPFYVSGEAEAW